MARSAAREAWLEEERKRIEYEEVKDCTFKPKITRFVTSPPNLSDPSLQKFTTVSIGIA